MKHCSGNIPAVMLVPADHRVFARCPALNETSDIQVQNAKREDQIANLPSQIDVLSDSFTLLICDWIS